MPIYFTDVAPTCPISRDEPTGLAEAPIIRTTIPHAFDLASAIAAVNIARTILQQIVSKRTINNTYGQQRTQQTLPQANNVKTVNKLRHSRWTEITSQRQTHNYKYYAYDSDGNKDTDTWILTQRIEHMVWHDSAWQTYLVWNYGNKGEGESQ